VCPSIWATINTFVETFNTDLSNTDILNGIWKKSRILLQAFDAFILEAFAFIQNIKINANALIESRRIMIFL
jgi:hypothetical protein